MCINMRPGRVRAAAPERVEPRAPKTFSVAIEAAAVEPALHNLIWAEDERERTTRVLPSNLLAAGLLEELRLFGSASSSKWLVLFLLIVCHSIYCPPNGRQRRARLLAGGWLAD